MKKTVLSTDNMEQIKNDLSQFFSKHKAPIQERTYTNCTLSKAIRGNSLDQCLKSEAKVVVKNVDIAEGKQCHLITINADNPNKNGNTDGPLYFFKPETIFAFKENKVFAKVPCTYYGKENIFRYIIVVFEA